MHATSTPSVLSTLAGLTLGGVVGLSTSGAVMWGTHGSLMEAAAYNGPWFLGLLGAGGLAGAGIELAVARRSTRLTPHVLGPLAVAALGVVGTGLGAGLMNQAMAQVTDPDTLARLASQGSLVALGTAASGARIAGLLALYGAARRVMAEAYDHRDALVAETRTPWMPALGVAVLGGGALWAIQMGLGLGGGVGVFLGLVAGVALCASASRQAFEPSLAGVAAGATVLSTLGLAAGDWVGLRMAAMRASADSARAERFDVVTAGLATVDLALWVVPAWAALAVVGAAVVAGGRRPRLALWDVVGMGVLLAGLGLLALGAAQPLAEATSTLLEGARAVAS